MPGLGFAHWIGRCPLRVPRFAEPVDIADVNRVLPPSAASWRKLWALSILTPWPHPGIVHWIERIPVGVGIPCFTEPGGIFYFGVMYLFSWHVAHRCRFGLCVSAWAPPLESTARAKHASLWESRDWQIPWALSTVRPQFLPRLQDG